MSEFHEPGTPCPVHMDEPRTSDCRWCRENVTVQARSLGIEHGAANIAPFGAPADLDESALMTVLGETSETTPGNQPFRMRLIEVYVAGMADAQYVNQMCVRRP